jgi:SAM-dependent methyltransferase
MTTERYRDYDAFAWLYSHYWGANYHDQAMAVLERLILEQAEEGWSVLDLCCGDGRLARELCERGLQVTGLDGSEEMLSYAQGEAPEATFVLGDARDFRLVGTFDLTLSTFDALNHVMKLSELKKVFRNVWRALRPGGYFAFDLNREGAYQRLWSRTSGTADHRAVSIARGSYDKRKGVASCEITLFRKQGRGWARSDFTLRQKHHREEDVMAALTAAGFGEVELHDAREELGMLGDVGMHRTFYLARR